jgi:iron complex transport system substrate-binding protein
VRIASLLPSATEIAFALGLGDQVVGVTFECNHPGDPRIGRAIVVGGLHTEGMDAAAIDAAVAAKVAAGENLYELDRTALGALAPDLVLTQDLCRVCALPAGEVELAVASLGCAAAVVTLDPHTLDEVLDTIAVVGAATARGEQAAILIAGLRDRLAAIATAVAGRPRPSVFVLEWPDPPFVAGHWVPELVAAAGAEAVLGRPGERSVATTWEEIAAADPDIVVVASCGFGVDTTVEHANQVLGQLPSRAAVWAMDGDGLVVRPGPRLVDGVEAIAAIVHGVEPLDPHAAQLVRRGH